MAELVDPLFRVWMGGRSHDTPRLAYFHGGRYYLLCLGLFNQRVQCWRVDPAAGGNGSHVASGGLARANFSLQQQGWQQLDSAPRFDFATSSAPVARLMYLSGEPGNVESIAISGFSFAQEIFTLGTSGPFAGLEVFAPVQYHYDNNEALKPIKCAVVLEGATVAATHYIFGDQREIIGPSKIDRARTQRFNEGAGFTQVQDISGITSTGTSTHSRPRAAALNVFNSTVADVWCVMDDSSGVRLMHNRAGPNISQATPSRLTPYWFVGDSIDVGLPWHSRNGRQAICYARNEDDELYVHYGPLGAFGAWALSGAVRLPDPPVTRPGGRSVQQLCGVVIDGRDHIYAVGVDQDGVLNRILMTEEDGEGQYSDWRTVAESDGNGPISNFTLAPNRDGDQACLFWEHNPEGSAELGREVYWQVEPSEQAGGSLSGPGAGIGGGGTGGSAFYVS